jgi:hypothetical protein
MAMDSPICAVCRLPVGAKDSAAYCTATRTIFHLRCYLAVGPRTEPEPVRPTSKADARMAVA